MLAGHDGDAQGRAHGLAQHAADAARGAVVADGEAVAAAVPRHERPELLRVLVGDRGAQVQETAEAVSDVQTQVPEEVLEGRVPRVGGQGLYVA